VTSSRWPCAKARNPCVLQVQNDVYLKAKKPVVPGREPCVQGPGLSASSENGSTSGKIWVPEGKGCTQKGESSGPQGEKACAPQGKRPQFKARKIRASMCTSRQKNRSSRQERSVPQGKIDPQFKAKKPQFRASDPAVHGKKPRSSWQETPQFMARNPAVHGKSTIYKYMIFNSLFNFLCCPIVSNILQ
jgi:hypothetical protein